MKNTSARFRHVFTRPSWRRPNAQGHIGTLLRLRIPAAYPYETKIAEARRSNIVKKTLNHIAAHSNDWQNQSSIEAHENFVQTI